MAEKADFTDWQQVIALLKTSFEQGREETILQLLLTPDERESLLGRVNIVNELLKGDLSQRQISQLLGVGVATITRGSNELKQKDEETKQWLDDLLSTYRDS
ncbi:trp operon repressor [Thaumasiovibrio subtropicus]|uniref:trp operon repressor n=1 Tax=Thaumasiovibrio subtropicus TaxID=1891207 RepID=UPI000B35DA1C|nr:trp operon repressor [Thaumasiovibrio subtropicus]